MEANYMKYLRKSTIRTLLTDFYCGLTSLKQYDEDEVHYLHQTLESLSVYGVDTLELEDKLADKIASFDD